MGCKLIVPLVLLIIFACLDSTSAVFAKKFTKYCKKSMNNATSHKVFCRAITNKVVQKVYYVCRKGVTYSCKAAKLTGVHYKSCKLKLLDAICPNLEILTSTEIPTTTYTEGPTPAITSQESVTEENDLPDENDVDDDNDDDELENSNLEATTVA